VCALVLAVATDEPRANPHTRLSFELLPMSADVCVYRRSV